MTTTKIPKFGDPEILPKGVVRRPSVERQPFDNRGRLKPDGPGPLKEERFYEAPDLGSLPQWKRTRGNEWTTQEFRKLVFAFLIAFFDVRKDWARKWDITEVASAVRSGRLPEDLWHLVIGVTQKEGGRIETSVMFPPHAREDNPTAVAAVLAQAAEVLDVLHAQAE